MAGNTVSLKEAWKIMHDTIRVDEAYLKLITDHSMAPRHGRQFTHQGEINTEISKRAWIVVDRYIEFKKRGRQPLTLVEFPLLAG